MSANLLSVLSLAAVLASSVAAHTTSLSYVPGAAAGTVEFWTGSYDYSSAPASECIVTLTGSDVTYNHSAAFNLEPVSVKPIGLVDGTNNFFSEPRTGEIYPRLIRRLTPDMKRAVGRKTGGSILEAVSLLTVEHVTCSPKIGYSKSLARTIAKARRADCT